MLNKRYITAMAAGALLTASVGGAALSFADSTPVASASTAGTVAQKHLPPGIGGTVTAVSGTTITVTGRNGKTYTVEAGSAAITKDMTVSVTDIAVGDTLMAAGTVSGTTVTATSIHDGKMPMDPGIMGHGGKGMFPHKSPPTTTTQ